jgi:adenylate kinase family enzyme
LIIMINGAFGAGKTTAAHRLLPLIPDSMIFDPEEIGCMLRNLVPEQIRHGHEQTDDFQDMDLWRILTVQTAQQLKLAYNKHLIVPMTLYKWDNFEYIYNGFQRMDATVRHFCLIASVETVHGRLAGRGDAVGGWSFQQTERCVQTLSDSRFEEYIHTDHLDTNGVVERILARIRN